MAKYLDDNGLLYFWGKIKAWVTNQGYTTNTGTITSVTMNGASKGTSGVVDLGTVITDVSSKQDTLVSGTNIKTINNESLLGSGNITIQGGGGQQQQADWAQTDSSAIDYIKNKPSINSFYYAAWTATYSNAISTKLTNILTLPEGIYILRGQYPVLNNEMATSLHLTNTTDSSGSTHQCYYTGRNYAIIYEILFVGQGGGEVYLQTAASVATTYTYITRGFISAIKIA